MLGKKKEIDYLSSAYQPIRACMKETLKLQVTTGLSRKLLCFVFKLSSFQRYFIKKTSVIEANTFWENISHRLLLSLCVVFKLL